MDREILIADGLRRHGAQPRRDMRQLWRRIVFNVLISNVDDHLRNHGFLYADHRGWRLSPVYDLNPVPVDIQPRVLSTAIDADDPSASVELALWALDTTLSFGRARMADPATARSGTGGHPRGPDGPGPNSP